MKISYAITVNDEKRDLEFLVKELNELGVRQRGDEIIVQFDTKSTIFDSMGTIFESSVDRMYRFPLNNDFATFKNELKSYCAGDYIFQIDADETPNKYLVHALPAILEMNQVDLYIVPRANFVTGITQEHIQKWGWKIDEQNRINWPDFQTRIYINKPELKWENKIHERIIGYKTMSQFPIDTKDYALYHIKSITKQEQQNNFYAGFTN